MIQKLTKSLFSLSLSLKDDDPRSLNLLPTPSLSQQQRVDNNNNTINSAETSSLSEQLRPTTKPTTDHSFPDVYIFEPKLWVPENQTVNEQLLLSNEVKIWLTPPNCLFSVMH